MVNGDIVDFLLDDDFESHAQLRPWTSDQREAVCKLNKIVERTRQFQERGPFEAWSRFLEKGHRLTFILGNHDLELSLPEVRNHLSYLLRAEGRDFQFVYDGEACVRGDLLIEHGNRYDGFNIIDHSALRQERSALSRGMPLSGSPRLSGRFSPPAGSLLVTEVFNTQSDTIVFWICLSLKQALFCL